MPKSSKTFILSNGRVNSHGFRIITDGIDISDFVKNPIMYWMHSGSDDKLNVTAPDQMLPIGHWTDIKKNSGELTAVPVFDDNDPFAMKIYNKVEHGTIRAASVSISPGRLDTDKSNWYAGQTSPTFLTSKIDEASIVDRGSNSDAVTLSSSGSIYLKTGNQLSAGSERYVMPEQQQTDQYDKRHSPPEMLDIMDNAVAAGKFTRMQADQLLKAASGKPEAIEALKGIVRGTPVNPNQVQGGVDPAFSKMCALKSFDEIEAKDIRCRYLASRAPELYKAKFFEKKGYLPRVMPNG